MSYTPGPWMVDHDEPNYVFVTNSGGVDELVATAYAMHENSEPGARDHLDNARLIAAAPELLKAWKKFFAHRSRVFEAQVRGKVDEIPLNALDKIFEMAEAAIAKAEASA